MDSFIMLPSFISNMGKKDSELLDYVSIDMQWVKGQQGGLLYVWIGGSWLKIHTEACLEWKFKVSSEPEAKNWVTG